MDNSSPLSDTDILNQENSYHFAPPAQMDANQYRQNTSSQSANVGQQLPWTSHEPPPGYVSSNNNTSASDSNAVTIHQQPVLQMELPPPIPSSITTSRPQSSMQPLQLIRWAQRPKFATSFWEEEGTLCYQVDANSVCVARRQDNDMINGTKLLNVTGMSRGKRDGVLKNEKARVVVKVGPMHLKGVWITFNRAKELSRQFKISELLHPLFLDDPSVYFQNMQNQALPVQFVPPNQTEIAKEQTHEFERYEYSDGPSFEANTFSQNTPSVEMSEPFPLESRVHTGATTLATITPMSNMISSYFSTSNAVSESRRASPITHHVYPSYKDSNSNSPSNSNNSSHQAAFNHFLTQESYENHCLTGFTDSPLSIVPLATPSSTVPAIHTQKNYEFQTAATKFQRFNADDMLLSASTVSHHQQQQQYHRSPHPIQQPQMQQQFVPYSAPSERGPSSFLYTPPLSANNSTLPTPTDPSATFQFELNSSQRQRNMSHHRPNNTFVSNPYQQQQQQQYLQQQQQQMNGFNLYF
ncbi:hypothetical protein PS15p_211293 [Mucor circinelloides]